MTNITIRPEHYRQFGPSDGAVFCLVTNSEIVDRFNIEKTGGYRDYQVFTSDREGEINSLLRDEIPARAHVLVVSPMCFFRSPEPEMIGGERKLIAMACNSTPTSMDAVEHFIDIIEKTDPARQKSFADRFFELGPELEYLEIVDEVQGTSATFQHLSDDYEWNIQAGPMEWGEQQIAPAGEISVLPADIWDFSDKLRLTIEGEVTFHGLPILHSGEVSFLREDQSRLFSQLKTLHNGAVVAKVKDGAITDLRPATSESAAAAKTLETMFDVDSRYRTLWEIGFAINTEVKLLWENIAMNEVYGGSNGCLHFGLGLTPYTQYHLDIICPNTKVVGPSGELLLGGTLDEMENEAKVRMSH